MALLEVDVGLDETTRMLTLAPRQYSATITKIINGLPNRAWDAGSSSWRVPAEDIVLVRRALLGFKLNIAGSDAMADLIGAALAAQPPLPLPTAEPIEYEYKTKPFDHQKVGTSLATTHLNFALLMEQGTGKTKTQIDALSYLMQRGKLDGALIICPKAVLYNWAVELDLHSPLPKDERRCVVVEGDRADKLLALQSAAVCHFIIINYEGAVRYEDELSAILKRRRMAVVLDESTRIKNHASQQAKACTTLGLRASARYILNGTPITQSPLDAFSQFKFLDSNILGHHNYYSFRAEYTTTISIRTDKMRFPHKKVVGYKNLDRLAKRIAAHSYRVLKKDCLDLPDKIYRTLELAMSPKQAAFYKQMKEESVAEASGVVLSAPLVVTRLLRLQQISSGYAPVINEFKEETGQLDLEGPKLEAALELIQEAADGGQKTIVWSRFVRDVEALYAMLEKVGVKAVSFYGETSAADRQKNIEAFQTQDEVKVFVGQLQSGGIGITLTAASNVIYLSNSFELYHRLQSEDRAHRIGQTRKVLYTDLVCSGIDKYVLKCLRGKKDLADVITGDNARQLFEEM